MDAGQRPSVRIIQLTSHTPGGHVTQACYVVDVVERRSGRVAKGEKPSIRGRQEEGGTPHPQRRGQLLHQEFGQGVLFQDRAEGLAELADDSRVIVPAAVEEAVHPALNSLPQRGEEDGYQQGDQSPG